MYKRGDFSGPFEELSFITFLAIVMVVFVVDTLKGNLGRNSKQNIFIRIKKSLAQRAGLSTCASAYRKSQLSTIPSNSYKIPPKQANFLKEGEI